jgi:hypothetical protein
MNKLKGILREMERDPNLKREHLREYKTTNRLTNSHPGLPNLDKSKKTKEKKSNKYTNITL